MTYDIYRYLREKILDIENSEIERHLTQSLQSDEREAIADYNERLEARHEILEDHNKRLEHQLEKFRQLLHQVERSKWRKNSMAGSEV